MIFIATKKYKTTLNEFFGISEELDKKISVLLDDLKQGFSLFKKRNLERFVQGYNEIEDFAEQFVILEYYYSNNNKFANTEEVFKILYGETLGLQKWQEKCNRVKGENNPGFQHNGKFSSFSKNFKYYSDMSEEEKEYITTLNKKKLKKLRNDNPWMYGKRKKEHWIKKGYSEEEAMQNVSKTQATFSLKKCIEKHGKEVGTKRWKERQEKWQNTLKSKSPEEIADINRRKSSGIGRCLDRDAPGKLYYICFYNKDFKFFKIGITTQTVEERFKLNLLNENHKLNYEIQFINDFDTIQEAYIFEQKILSHYNDKRITIDYNGFYTTEAFKENVLEEFYETV